jgi:hypothetical protein
MCVCVCVCVTWVDKDYCSATPLPSRSSHSQSKRISYRRLGKVRSLLSLCECCPRRVHLDDDVIEGAPQQHNLESANCK